MNDEDLDKSPESRLRTILDWTLVVPILVVQWGSLFTSWALLVGSVLAGLCKAIGVVVPYEWSTIGFAFLASLALGYLTKMITAGATGEDS